jgi:ribosomal protein S18 acetylase RimI-like enzyme
MRFEILSAWDESAPGGRVIIIPASWRDLNNLRHLEQTCFPKDAWPLLDVVGVLTLPNVVRLKALFGEVFAGFIAGDIRNSQHTAWIATIGVLPEFRQMGIGRALLRGCESQLPVPRVCLCVRASNSEAIKLYSSEGYQQSDLWFKYYQDGEDALVMEKKLLK